jgi:hypothetical protein
VRAVVAVERPWGMGGVVGEVSCVGVQGGMLRDFYSSQ